MGEEIVRPEDQQSQPSAESFRVPASDNKGHSSRIWARIQPGMDRQLETVVSSKWFPYRSKGDVVRHALTRHFEWLETLAPIPSVTRQVDAIVELVRDEEYNTDFQEVFERLAGQVSRHLASGRNDLALTLVRRVVDQIEHMPEDSSWRDVYMEEVERRFAHMLAGGKASFKNLLS